jgi:hypothetical protein
MSDRFGPVWSIMSRRPSGWERTMSTMSDRCGPSTSSPRSSTRSESSAKNEYESIGMSKEHSSHCTDTCLAFFGSFGVASDAFGRAMSDLFGPLSSIMSRMPSSSPRGSSMAQPISRLQSDTFLGPACTRFKSSAETVKDDKKNTHMKRK